MPNSQLAYINETRLTPWLPGYCISDKDIETGTTFVAHASLVINSKERQVSTACNIVTGMIYKCMILSKF